jgi:tetratricopeptide (TPR) repeat protein
MPQKTIAAAMTIVLLVCAGCQTQMQNKKAAKERFDKASIQMKLTLAQQQYDQGNYVEAAKTLQQCLAVDSDNPEAELLHGKLLLANDRRDEAIEKLSLVLQRDRNLHEGWYWLGVATQADGNYQKAYEYYDKALTLEPTNVDYILATAEVLVAQGNCSQAARLLNDKMAILPSDVSLKIAAAELMWRIGENQRAIRLYKQAMSLTNDNSQIAESLGYCYAFSNKWDQASEVFSKLLENCTDDQQKKLYLQVAAMCSMNCAKYDKAVSCYDKLSIFERDNAQIWVKMGQAALGAGAAGRAFMCGQKALSLQPGLPDAIVLIGCAQYVAGDYTAAVMNFEKIVKDKKNAALACSMKARCYEKLDQAKKAELTYKEALEINPHSELANLLVKGKNSR